MSEYKTLQEIHNTLGITRRAIQGYEEIGLVRASDKNKYGYLLYGECEVRRIEKIKMYQEFGFKLKEERKKLNTLISQAEALIKELSKEQATGGTI